MTKETKIDIKKSLTELEKITNWFQDDEIDLDIGLEKLKDGVKIIKQCRERIKEIENEFIDIKNELEDTEEKTVEMDTEELFNLESLDLN